MPFKLFTKKSKRKKDDAATVDVTPAENLGKVFKELDCPICFNTCVPPIHSCVNGHLICGNCLKNCSQCPSCRQPFTGTRNFFAENFVNNCSQKCRYEEDGCPFLQLRGADMMPHEVKCMFRPVVCVVPECREEVPYRQFLTHLTLVHKITGKCVLPATIQFTIDQPLINNKKWLPYAIQAYGNNFYIMMEVTRPHFWVWVWLQNTKLEDAYESFTAQIKIENVQKRLKITWEGPVHSLRINPPTIKSEGLCFVIHELQLQHFNSEAFTLHVDILRPGREEVKEGSTISCFQRKPLAAGNALNFRTVKSSSQSLYNRAIFCEGRPQSETITETDYNNNNTHHPSSLGQTESLASKGSIEE